ncbi:MAG: type IX secretion system outer membrane channel protein PorV [Bacteroidia bacterium]|nr:type IX secretion system outer membrane channel protein PorV [Bacteroidia bacterium]
MKQLEIASLIAGLCCGGLATAQIDKNELLGQINVPTTAVPFLIISPDSRAGGMGDAGVASTPDANSIHWNAAKMGFLKKKMGLSVSYTPWLRALVPDINIAYLSAYRKIKKAGVFAGSLRYFSLGNITFTDIAGNEIGQFNPNEFAIDGAYATKLGDNFSMGGAMRFIYSNLTGGQAAGGNTTKAGTAFAVDISAYYHNTKVEVGGKKSTFMAGLNISNIGSKISYTNIADSKDFIPINLRLGAGLDMNIDDFNTVGFLFEINKLMVPTPPVYEKDANGNPVPGPNGTYLIAAGKDPDRGIVSGMFGSFSDAPAGFEEELREYNLSGGLEYWYDKQFAVRAGYFYEHETKGNRKYFTVGIGLRYNVFGLDMAYLIPTVQKHPLQNTLRFTLQFDLDAFKDQDKNGGGDQPTN